MAIAEARSIAGTQRNVITINVVDTCVLVRLTTDMGVVIREERVLLIRPDGKTIETRTDGHGDAYFARLGLPPGTPLFVVLPDVLEAWNDEVVAYELTPAGKREIAAVPAAEFGGYGDMEAHRALNKDQVDKLEKAKAWYGIESEVNQRWAGERDYRGKDTTKYLVYTAKDNAPAYKTRLTLKIDRLTPAEKFDHFTETFEAGRAWYHAGKLNYDGEQHRWYARQGAVCNQLVNIFMGYWANFNNAYTGGATSTNCARQMENDSATDHTNSRYPYRGFREVLGDQLETPTKPEQPDESVPNKSWTYKARRDGTRVTFNYVRIREDDLEEVNGQYRFRHEWQDQLATYNAYSYATKKDGKLVYDHHCGFLIKDPQKGLLTFAADGYKSAAGVYSHTLIKVKPPTQLQSAGKDKELHLVVWPLRALRPGGYAPAAEGGEYRTDDELGDLNSRKLNKQSEINPHFRQSLSRFVVWDAAVNPS